MKALAILALIVVHAASAVATVTVTTPALRVHSSSTAVCRISNITGASIAVDVRIKDASNNTALLTHSGVGIAYARTAEETYTGTTTLMYCAVDFANNGEADASTVSFAVQDSSGTAVSAVRGTRVGNHIGSASVVTGSLNSGTGGVATYECSVLTDTTQTVTITLYRDAASGTSASNVSISSGQAYTITDTEPVYCWAIASSGTNANKLRVAVYESVSGVGSGPALAAE
jgi:hypothetical protein